ncbi:RNA polymerase sigma-70 factor [Flavobacterium alkalisoli]|uniref:RNA polymerase sigma-70 factor n=1 Tax=Flavobacterium alkalisoli TaxID=2602769 RepID=A0A5B9FWZ9_9FLAO|nr:RNA polymerase sigma-70 factor [Flavobacterium alkalisoli]QEE49217.1 RNA polymerase sigma-70 factor [Flavobacterium alkalisoli]
MRKKLTSLSDSELQNLLKEGSQDAFGVIFDRYWKKLYNYAYKIYREEEICQDIVQEIFISLWNNSGEAVILNLEGYLMRAVKYRVANHIRSLKFTQEHEDALLTIADPVKTANDIEYREFEQGILNEIDKLSPKCREVFLLSRFENYTNSEIAKKLDLSIHTVEKHISNAIKHLRTNLDNYQLAIIVISLFL